MKPESARVRAWLDSKRKPCPSCGALILHTSKTCVSCRTVWSRGDITLEQAIYHNHHKASAFALVRTRARAILKKAGLTSCRICGYSQHVEAAHLRPISSFPLETKISVINAIENICPLCPNHHWEFDQGILPEILKGFKIVGYRVGGAGRT